MFLIRFYIFKIFKTAIKLPLYRGFNLFSLQIKPRQYGIRFLSVAKKKFKIFDSVKKICSKIYQVLIK